ncbi:hypothetical protein [Anaeroarcus burkinensis]|uniref:hypothetical protein n=1 Tax=Anaeroarcus burkinensis TaxID=82376 RepID=UPI000400E473|nr:hypothetical protein [Anaeroarcus burkinensis]
MGKISEQFDALLKEFVETKGLNGGTPFEKRLEHKRFLAKQAKDEALKRTKEDVRQFNQRRKSLGDSIQQDSFLKDMAKALLRVKQTTSEKTFIMFYSVYFEENTLSRVNFSFGGDSAKACNKVLEELAISLYPDLMMQYMLDR